MAEERVELPVMYFPTRVVFPLWARRNAILLRQALNNLRIGEVTVRRLTTKFELPKGLVRPYISPRLPPALDPTVYLEAIKSEAPVDGVEVVEWMQFSFADYCALSARILEYNRAGSQLVGSSGDGYIPGVVVEDIRYVSQTGAAVRNQGYAIAETPAGRFNVPTVRKGYGIFRDLLSAGTMSWCGEIQFVGNLLKWKELARTPIRQTVGFFTDARGNTVANFFEQLPTRPALTVTVRQRFTSSDSQTIRLTFRDPTDYTRVLGQRSFDVAEGQSEVSFTMSAFPYVPPTIAQIEPEDNKQTSLDEYVVL
jgi:hypothetical protein